MSKGPLGLTGPKGHAGTVVKGAFPDLASLPSGATDGDTYLVGKDLYVSFNGAWTNMAGPIGPVGSKGSVGPKGRVFHKIFMTFSNGKFCLIDLEEEMLDSFVYPMFPDDDEIALFSMTYPAKGRRISLMYNK